MERHFIHLKINGESHRLEVESKETLLHVLRDRLALTGTKEGCGRGECGSCNVLVNGRPMNSCLILAVAVQDQEISTIEGLLDQGELHPLQKSFIDHGAVQCGFCTPGMILTAKGFLDEFPQPSEEDVRRALVGNFCRCTGYAKIIDAVMATRED
jgi:aerobic-type carbon monoxide dehydrogenase small subunit (CoxS/CutS family)